MTVIHSRRCLFCTVEFLTINTVLVQILKFLKTSFSVRAMRTSNIVRSLFLLIKRSFGGDKFNYWLLFAYISFSKLVTKCIKSEKDFIEGCLQLYIKGFGDVNRNSYLFPQERFYLCLVKLWLAGCSLCCFTHVGQASEIILD